MQIVEVEGTVVQNGVPLEKIMVEFWPESEGPRSFATTDASGHFKLVTDDGKRTGASVGSHRVLLKDVTVLGDKFMGRAGEDVAMGQGRKSRIDGKYSSVTTSPVNQVVDAGGNTNLEIEAKQKL